MTAGANKKNLHFHAKIYFDDPQGNDVGGNEYYIDLLDYFSNRTTGDIGCTCIDQNWQLGPLHAMWLKEDNPFYVTIKVSFELFNANFAKTAGSRAKLTFTAAYRVWFLNPSPNKQYCFDVWDTTMDFSDYKVNNVTC
ncbi:MAG: hypothetical protein ACXVAY_21665 [Mucilaginibacter sp.]